MTNGVIVQFLSECTVIEIPPRLGPDRCDSRCPMFVVCCQLNQEPACCPHLTGKSILIRIKREAKT